MAVSLDVQSCVSASFPDAHSIHKLLISVHCLKHERNPLTAADAQGHDAALDAIPLHRVKEAGGQDRAGGTDRMTMRDGTAFDVHDILSETQLPCHRDGDCGEC